MSDKNKEPEEPEEPIDPNLEEFKKLVFEAAAGKTPEVLPFTTFFIILVCEICQTKALPHLRFRIQAIPRGSRLAICRLSL
jgi:hypothetical protein